MSTFAFLSLAAILLSTQTFRPEQFVATGSFDLNCPVTDAFPMFEPIGEKRWAEGWDPKPIYPDDIEPNVGTVFETLGKKGVPSIWTICRYEKNRKIEYNVVTPGHDVTQITVLCLSSGGKTHVEVTYRITGLAEKGNELGRAHKDHYSELMEHWHEHISRALKCPAY